jgi:hypothetical protein
VNSTRPVFDVTDSTIVGHAPVEQVFAGLGFEYHHAVKDWLAVRFSFHVAGRLGTSSYALISEGATAALGYNLGWKLRIYQSRSVIVSGSVGLGNTAGTFLNLTEWVQAILEDREVPLVAGRSSLDGSGGVQAGWGISRRFGVLGSLTLLYGESFSGEGENGWSTDVRVTGSYDARPDIKIPVGLVVTLGRHENRAVEGAQHGIWFWSARLAAQSREDFSVGLDLQSSYYTTQEDADMQWLRVIIDMRYFY